jgi:hypothetical protein
LAEERKETDFEDLDFRCQDAIVDLIVSVIKNAEKTTQEE